MTTVPMATPRPVAASVSSYAETALVGVYEISKLLASANRLEPTLAGVLGLLSSFLDMRHGLIALLNTEGDPEVVVGSGWSEANAADYFERLPEQAIGQIVATRMPLVVPDVQASPLFAGSDLSGWGPTDGAPFSLIGVPIKDHDQVIGTLTIDRMVSDHALVRFDHDVRFLTMIANLVGQTLRLHSLVARDRERLMAEKARLEKDRVAPPVSQRKVEGIVGDSPAVLAVIDKVRLVAKSKATVLLRGESGTGKELFASAIHNLSPRAGRPFVKLNCAALPESVLESELFGHEKGAFTGAVTQRKGRFEMADGGTLFLDEIGEISPAFQAKLLRVLQEGEFERVGGTRTIKVDVRLVCATNRNLEDAVSRGEFRADLYYRISVVPIFLPPLRERRGDMPALANEFLQRFNEEHGTKFSLTTGALGVLSECNFPGNIRELENCVHRTATLAKSDQIVERDFSCRSDVCLSSVLWKGGAQQPTTHPGGYTALPVLPSHDHHHHQHQQPYPGPEAAAPVPPAAPAPYYPAAAPALPEQAAPEPAAASVPVARGSERQRLIDAMEKAGWVKAKAARILGLTPRQISYALQKHEVPIKKF